MKQKTKKKVIKAVLLLLGAALLYAFIFEARFYIPHWIRPPRGQKPMVVEMRTTAYCHCKKCCSYKWFFFIPYQKTSKGTYRKKAVGLTATETVVRPGCLAADTSKYPYGTIMYVPGYGYGRVEDIGGAIKGEHIDLYRPNHLFARAWGSRTKKVKVWLPKEK